MPRRKLLSFGLILIAFAGFFGLGIWVGVTKIAYNVPQPGTIDFSLFWDAYNKLEQNFIDPSKIDNDQIIYGAIQGMTDSLADPYTSFFDPEQAYRFQQDLSGSFEGIGAEIGIKKDSLTIIAPLEGTPAKRAGIKAGDIIVKVDDKETSSMTIEDAVSAIRGPRGTTVTLTIFRSDWPTTKDIRITRDTIVIPPMEWEVKNGDVAYIKIYQFDESLSSDFRSAVSQILQSSAKKIILDLRNNPGGYLEVAQDIAGWFLKNGQTVTIEDFGQSREQELYKAKGNSALANYPVVVLINQGSASASEILAGALRDNRSVKLVGEKSFGKGSVQEVVNLRGGSFLKITIAKWLTPNGHFISEVGLEPDVEVEMTDKDFELENDPQLEKALEIIASLR